MTTAIWTLNYSINHCNVNLIVILSDMIKNIMVNKRKCCVSQCHYVIIYNLISTLLTSVLRKMLCYSSMDDSNGCHEVDNNELCLLFTLTCHRRSTKRSQCLLTEEGFGCVWGCLG